MDNSVLSRIVRIIVDIADPDSIILFGSRATETARDDSDIQVYPKEKTKEPVYKTVLYRALTEGKVMYHPSLKVNSNT